MKPSGFALGILFCAHSFAAAQTAKPPSAEPSSIQPITVTGCVARGSSPDTFALTSATIVADPTRETLSMPDRTTADPKANTKMAYALSGGHDLAAHVGHKVTVTGTRDTMGLMMRPGEITEATLPRLAGSTPEMSGGALRVMTLKMVSTTCP